MNTTDGVAESSSQAAENYSDMATSAEATVEAQENALASFDQINKLADNSSSSDTNASPVVGTLSGNTISTTVDVDTSDADKKLKDFFYWVKSSFNTIFTPFNPASATAIICSRSRLWTAGAYVKLGPAPHFVSP